MFDICLIFAVKPKNLPKSTKSTNIWENILNSAERKIIYSKYRSYLNTENIPFESVI